MKKISGLLVFLLVALSLAACSGAAAGSNPSTTTTSSGPLTADYDNALPVPLQLAAGTFQLENTPNAVDGATAAQLLPLWKAVRSLSTSDTTAPEELDAVYKQIQDTMTTSQIQAIADMKLTTTDMRTIAQDMGLNFGAGGNRFANLTPEQQATAEAFRQNRQGGGGFFPGGGVPGGGPGGDGGGQRFSGGGFPPPGEFGGAPPGGANNNGSNATPPNGSGTGTDSFANGNRFGSIFYDAVINLLQKKTSS
jgi:hypothetical protein